ncbi:hypothetical protein pEaSNUABM37_00311 [Erwinia phage pEa_SNUABM_37]|nr:hypothetical protein pEaSNUABM37_00311 [Erwinia phage pEa_SNUABM_37]QXO10779.1 hypothetical protein pEaSNUABM48_00311 [Erwinia phage pEa_SNUABM_48]
MLESILGGKHTPWVPPSMDANTLFRLVDFKATTDIVDRGPSGIVVARNGAPDVGTDDIYSYIQFTAGKYLTFTSSLLNRTNIELTWVVGEITKLTTPYSGPLLDTRPMGTNGNYHILTINQHQAAPFTMNYNYPSSSTAGLNTSIKPNDGPYVIKLQLRSTGTRILVNDAVFYGTTQTSSLDTTYMKIGRSAFYNPVPDLQLRLYFFEIKALT